MHPPLTFTCESLAAFVADTSHLWEAHWAELAPKNMPLGLDLAQFSDLEDRGMLVVLLARSRGRAVGYMIAVVRPHTHYSSVLCGFEDLYYLAPEYRTGFAGVKLISAAVRALRARGCKKAFFMSNKAKPTDSIFQYLGFTNTHSCYGLWLGDE